jgi:hypothetical protein
MAAMALRVRNNGPAIPAYLLTDTKNRHANQQQRQQDHSDYDESHCSSSPP